MFLCDVTFNHETQTAEFIAWKPVVKGVKKGLSKISRLHPMGGIYRDTAKGLEGMRRWNKKALAEGAGPIKRFKGSMAAMRRPLGRAATVGSPFGSAAGQVLYKGAEAAGKTKGGVLEKTKAGLRGAGRALKGELKPTGTIATGLGAPVGKIHMVQKGGKALTKKSKQLAKKGGGIFKQVGKTLTTPVDELWRQGKATRALATARPQLPRSPAPMYNWTDDHYAKFARTKGAKDKRKRKRRAIKTAIGLGAGGLIGYLASKKLNKNAIATITKKIKAKTPLSQTLREVKDPKVRQEVSNYLEKVWNEIGITGDKSNKELNQMFAEVAKRRKYKPKQGFERKRTKQQVYATRTSPMLDKAKKTRRRATLAGIGAGGLAANITTKRKQQDA